ncbi:MAG: hypothetical protein AAB649_03755, partial [Patescibacteria group bacterium]
ECPGLSVSGGICNPKLHTITLQKSQSSIAETEEWLEYQIRLIEESKDKSPALNNFCFYCEYLSSCEAVKETIENPFAGIKEEMLNVEQAEKLHRLVNGKRKLLENLEELSADYIKSWIKATSKTGETVTINNRKYAVKQQAFKVFDVGKTMTLLQTEKINPTEYFKVVNAAIKDLAFERTELKDKLDKLASTSYFDKLIPLK